MDFHALKGVFNLHHGQTEFMDYFYKRFDSALDTCKLKGCNETSFPGLEKYGDDNKDARQHMAAMCIIKTADPQHSYHICNELENGTTLGYFTNMCPKTIAKDYVML